MGENSAIEWCDHTFNPWIGCTQVSPACDHCYAQHLMDHRLGRVEWGGDRSRTSAANWRQPVQWNRKAKQAGKRALVFCASLADVWDNQVDPVWRRDLFSLIEQTPDLTWLLLSKRIGNAERMCDVFAGHPALPGNVALGATMANQEEWNRDAWKLEQAAQNLGALFSFASIEPLLGPVDIREHTPAWIIAGGESGAHARPWSIQWARQLRDQCAQTGTPFFWKQHGEWAPAGLVPSETPGKYAFGDYEHDRSAMIITDHFPRAFTRFAARSTMQWVGKKAAGATLDGREWREMPNSPLLDPLQ